VNSFIIVLFGRFYGVSFCFNSPAGDYGLVISQGMVGCKMTSFEVVKNSS
jgi:hypothetical protein